MYGERFARRGDLDSGAECLCLEWGKVRGTRTLGEKSRPLKTLPYNRWKPIPVLRGRARQRLLLGFEDAARSGVTDRHWGRYHWLAQQLKGGQPWSRDGLV
jgi:hypothetical protein